MHKRPSLAVETFELLLHAFVPALAGFLLAGLAISVVHLAIHAPGARPPSFSDALWYGWFVSFLLTFVPGLVLAAVFSVQQRTISSLCVVSVAVGWPILVLLFRADAPWEAHGEFPWPMFWREFVPFVPASFAFALGFMVTARWLASRRESHQSASAAA